MKTAVLLHGTCDKEEYFDMDFPSPSNAHWLPWLQQRFLRSNMLCQTPEMPCPYAPIYEEWKQIFEGFNLSSLSVVVGHSAGCGFILKWLHENPQAKLDKLVLVAPWLDPFREEGDFLKFDMKPDALTQIDKIHLLVSVDDMESVKVSVEKIISMHPKIILHTYEGKGHFCFGNIGNTFEELWEICK